MGLQKAKYLAALNGEALSPILGVSKNYKHWLSIFDERRCVECEDQQGQIYGISETADPEPPIHPRCRCIIQIMGTIQGGTATINGQNGADWTLLQKQGLPDYYVSKAEAKARGWKPGKWPCNFVPGKMVTGGIYQNKDGHLPQKTGRVWYEADINYQTGKRGDGRVVWSNDGLIFVSYDHYKTFYEIV